MAALEWLLQILLITDTAVTASRNVGLDLDFYSCAKKKCNASNKLQY